MVVHLVGHSAMIAGCGTAVLLALFLGLWFVYPVLA
jgi:hypothetical protein